MWGQISCVGGGRSIGHVHSTSHTCTWLNGSQLQRLCSQFRANQAVDRYLSRFWTQPMQQNTVHLNVLPRSPYKYTVYVRGRQHDCSLLKYCCFFFVFFFFFCQIATNHSFLFVLCPQWVKRERRFWSFTLTHDVIAVVTCDSWSSLIHFYIPKGKGLFFFCLFVSFFLFCHCQWICREIHLFAFFCFLRLRH